MRSMRSKKIKNQTSKYLVGPYDDSLIHIQLDKNEKCIHEISKQNFTRAAEFMRQINNDGEMISSQNPDKNIIKCLSLNTEAYLHEKQKKYDLALQCLDEAQGIEQDQRLSPIDRARTKLNKSVILIHLGRYDQSVQMAQRALDLLRQKKNMEEYELHKNQYKLYEIMITSFYNIASELDHLSDADGAHRVYKEGYYLAQKMLGPQHKLTLLLRSIIRGRNKSNSKSKEKLQISDIASNQSLSKMKSVFREQILPVKTRQFQLKRIYAPKRSSQSQVQQQRYLKNDTRYYLRSLQRMKQSKRRRQHTDSYQFQSIFNQRNLGKNRKLYTEVSSPHRYEEKIQHQKIKDIILNGKTINKTHVYPSLSRSHSIQKEKSLTKIKTQTQIPESTVTQLPILSPEKPKAQTQIQIPESTVTQLPKISPEKPKAQKDESLCQLI